jgi:hypothetical protein
LLFYHDADGHGRTLALPDSKGNVTLIAGKVYEYRCVKPVLDGGQGTYASLCGDPVLKADPADPNGSGRLIQCPKECEGEACRLFYSYKGGKWRRVKANDDGTGSKFTQTPRGLKIDPADLDELMKKMMFRCFCV